jgi:GT2 family glycosyltransferase
VNMMNPKVSIVILNWNGWKDTIECLESLYSITYSNYDIIVVDNGSEDDSIEKIRRYAAGKIEVKSRYFEYNPDNKPIEMIEYERERLSGKKKIKNVSEKFLILIKNEKNYGFAEGNNIGIKFALERLDPHYIFLLNNDVVVDSRVLQNLLRVSQSSLKIGAVQPKILRKDNPRLIDSVGQEVYWDGTIRDRWFGTYDDGRFDSVHEIFGGCAAALLIEGHVFEEIGFFDTDFFLIFEDVDLSWRMRLAGYETVLVPEALVYHKRGTSGIESPVSKYYESRNKLYIVLKYYPIKYILLFFPTYLYRFGLFLYLNCVFGNKDLLFGFFRKVKSCILQRSEKLKSPYYHVTVEKWVAKSDVLCWYKKAFRKAIRRILR